MSNQQFLGRGWSFPPTFIKSARTVQMLENENDINSSLNILLSTVMGERVMQPEYGCNLDDLLFETVNTTLKTYIVDKIKTAILYYEPRIDVQKIELNDSEVLEGKVMIEIDYIVRTTNSRLNYVYPFYKGEASEVTTPNTSVNKMMTS